MTEKKEPYRITITARDFVPFARTIYTTTGETTMKPPERILKTEKYEPYKPNRIIYSNETTVVFWQDGTKTVVTASEGDYFDKEIGFAMALAKKIFGSRSKYQRYIKDLAYVQPQNKKEAGNE